MILTIERSLNQVLPLSMSLIVELGTGVVTSFFHTCLAYFLQSDRSDEEDERGRSDEDEDDARYDVVSLANHCVFYLQRGCSVVTACLHVRILKRTEECAFN